MPLGPNGFFAIYLCQFFATLIIGLFCLPGLPQMALNKTFHGANINAQVSVFVLIESLQVHLCVSLFFLPYLGIVFLIHLSDSG